MKPVKFTEIFEEKNFLYLWVGQIISQFGDRLNQMALLALVYERAPGSSLKLAQLIFFIIIPVFFIGPIAGAYTDRWNRRQTMIVSDISRGLIVLLIPLFLLRSRSLLPVFPVVFLMFSITRFFLSSKLGIIPDLVSQNKLLLANSLSSTTMTTASILSLPLAGFLVVWLGVRGSFYIDSLTFFLSAGLLFMIRPFLLKEYEGLSFRIRFKHKQRRRYKESLILVGRTIEKSIKFSLWGQIKEGLTHLVRQKEIHSVFKMFFLLMAGLGAVSTVIIVFIQKSFHSVTGTKEVGLLGMFLGVGLLLGALIYGRFGQRMNKNKAISLSLFFSGILLCVSVILTERAASFPLTAISAFALGIFASPLAISLYTLLHETLPEKMRGRIFSSLEVVIHFSFLVFMFLAAILAERFHVPEVWILLCAGFLFAVCGLSQWTRPRVDRRQKLW